ncbi:uncharacterized protein LOC113136877 isoform X2 [Mastacembelus armatus]|uniref:uncharacterized protein LOC113136877 isoform X2 n=1 Tax=Mastacembelus armatus TaxID=205130 RepID=UPI000E455145|nr:uncharacterized protein LOC113136877 isoform X2 [Mastacembelus armatus]
MNTNIFRLSLQTQVSIYCCKCDYWCFFFLHHMFLAPALVLAGADLYSDSEIRSLTRQDLNELFPGPRNLKLRRRIFAIIHKQKPVNVILRELKEFIPHDSFKAAVTNNGVLVEYLPMLKDMKSHLNNVQEFLDAHIELLENTIKNQVDPEPTKGSLAIAHRPVEPHSSQTGGHQQEAQGTVTSFWSGWPVFSSSQRGDNPQAPQNIVMYDVIVGDKTFGADQQVMDYVKNHTQSGTQFIESNQDSRVTVVFCPISSRVGPDVDAAMKNVKVEKDVILVLMHHAFEAKNTTNRRTWNDYPNIKFHVNIFYHETMQGLLKCSQNDEAVTKIREKLMEYRTQRSNDTNADVLSMGDESGSTAFGGNGCQV